MTDILAYLRARPYPGRGILLGAARDGGLFCAYFIMGRSENSRNRVFERTEDGLRTRAFDEAKLTDPSLILYHPVRELEGALIVTNGDQTDSIRDALRAGGTAYAALAARAFEPDAPNYTPRISGVRFADGACLLAILKTPDGARCDRFFYSFTPAPGEARFLSTYEGFGAPRPSFSGEPVACAVPAGDAAGCARAVWEALDAENRVSLYVRVGGASVIINKNK